MSVQVGSRQHGLQRAEQVVDIVSIIPRQEQGRTAAPHPAVHGFVFPGAHDAVLDAASSPDDPGHFLGCTGLLGRQGAAGGAGSPVKQRQGEHADQHGPSGRIAPQDAGAEQKEEAENGGEAGQPLEPEGDMLHRMGSPLHGRGGHILPGGRSGDHRSRSEQQGGNQHPGQQDEHDEQHGRQSMRWTSI